LGQVGEFAFVLVAAGRDSGIIGPELFAGVVSTTMLSMFLAPYMVSFADPLAEKLIARVFKRPSSPVSGAESKRCKKALIVGFGPAGRKVTELLKAVDIEPEIIELNPAAFESADREGVEMHLGDATKVEVLEHAGIYDAAVVVVTIPDSRTAAGIIRMIRMLQPTVEIIVRGRYHRHKALLAEAGASLVVDEEEMVGEQLAATTVKKYMETDIYVRACRMIGKTPPSNPPPTTPVETASPPNPKEG